jgi:hypothetical protein
MVRSFAPLGLDDVERAELTSLIAISLITWLSKRRK